MFFTRVLYSGMQWFGKGARQRKYTRTRKINEMAKQARINNVLKLIETPYLTMAEEKTLHARNPEMHIRSWMIERPYFKRQDNRRTKWDSNWSIWKVTKN
eukprot:Clim_evm21s143 gene=Clim_evmTU21s143